MSDCPRCGTPSNSLVDPATLVAEDRAEIEFQRVGDVARTVTAKCAAAHGWLVQLSLVEHNTDDPVVRIAARNAPDEPSDDHIRVLLQSVRTTPWYPAIQFALAELAIAHADTIFAGS